MANPHAQVARLQPGELIATTDAMIDVFKRLAHNAEPSTPCMDIVQGPTESFQEFANRLIRAVEGSDLLRAVHNPVIMDCLRQKSHDDLKILLRSAPGRDIIPGEIIRYVLYKQKATPMTVEGLVAAIQQDIVSALVVMYELLQCTLIEYI